MRIGITWFLLIGLALSCLTVSGQNPSKKELKAAWKTIPSNIDECIKQLNVLFSDTAKQQFASEEEKIAVSNYNMMQGTAIRNNWRLWHGSVLSSYFNSYNIYNPEVMSRIVFVSYHRYLNNKPIALNDQVADYVASVDRLVKNPPKATDQFKIGDTILMHRFAMRGFVRDLLGKQPAYEVKAAVQKIDTTTQKFQVTVLQIKRTNVKETDSVAYYDFDKQLISAGSTFWSGVAGWRKVGQIAQIHLR